MFGKKHFVTALKKNLEAHEATTDSHLPLWLILVEQTSHSKIEKNPENHRST